MFNNDRYITSGVNDTIPLCLQIIMWSEIDTMQVESKDYLQVFKLTADNGKQKIVHTQEQPPYKQEYSVDADQPITAKIFVIDDKTHSTMLLADEY